MMTKNIKEIQKKIEEITDYLEEHERKVEKEKCEQLKEKYLELKEKEGNLVVQLNTITEAREQSRQNNKALEKENLYLLSQETKLRQAMQEIKEVIKQEGYINKKHKFLREVFCIKQWKI